MGTPDALYEEFASMVATPEGNRHEFYAIFERDLVEEDLILARALPKAGDGFNQRLKNIRSSHHEAARLVAMGKSDADVSLITGYTPARVWQLRQDPAFQELMAHYGGQIEDLYIDVNKRLAGFANDAMEVLHERLLEAPDKMRTRDLKDLVTMGLDRTGFGPKSTINTNIKAVVVTNAELERIKSEARNGASGAVRQLEIAPNKRPEVGGAGERSSLEEEAVERDKSEGDELREEVSTPTQLELALISPTFPLPVDRI